MKGDLMHALLSLSHWDHLLMLMPRKQKVGWQQELSSQCLTTLLPSHPIRYQEPRKMDNLRALFKINSSTPAAGLRYRHHRSDAAGKPRLPFLEDQ